MEDTIITLRDVRASGGCRRGAKQFCEEHRLDWDDFRLNGIAYSRVAHIDDSRLLKALEVARGRK